MISWFIGFQVFIGFLNILYGVTRLLFPKLSDNWVDPPRKALLTGVGLILFSILLWIVFQSKFVL